jgi:IstB-like ATP binding protein
VFVINCDENDGHFDHPHLSPNAKRKPRLLWRRTCGSGEWGQVITDPHLVAAIVDRVTFNAHILQTGTNSDRLWPTTNRRRSA